MLSMTSFGVNDMIKLDASTATALIETARGTTPSPRLSPLAERLAALPVKPTYSPLIIEGLARLSDLALVALSGLLAFHIYLGDHKAFDSAYALMTGLVALATLFGFQTAGLYHISALRGFGHAVLRLCGTWVLVFLIALAGVFFLKSADAFSRVFLAIWFSLGLSVISAGRAAMATAIGWLTWQGRLDRRTAIVGGGEPAESLIKQLQREQDTGLRLCGVFDDRTDNRSPDVVANYPKLGTVDDLVEFARRTRLDLVIFTLPVTAEQRLLQMLRKLWVLPIDIRLSAHMAKLRLRPRAYSYIGSVPVLDLFDKPIADWDLVLKWVFDKVAGWLLLIALSPLMLVTAIAIKLDSKGPVLFRQRRFGFNNELIEVLKFRSMYVDQADQAADKLVTEGDPRVTRVGRFIRKTSIDELPQLLNVVLLGNLSLVGPRPHALQAKAADRFYDQVVDGYFARHRVKPGITGWAQIHGWRGETDTREKIQKRVEHDLHYIENWSLLLDFFILLRTPFSLFNANSAY
jgi:Undecaprenyl-phosphate glucose phosphotransferase